jgi:hypothetical protein|tara:strand:- start:14964 stop:15338 length:375 start_codon:yes stop_codon:yes gene_type:complete
MIDDISSTIKKYPFLTGITYSNQEIVGIIQNHNNQITSIYCFGKLRNEEHKKKFLHVGETWWWESNRITPINLFLPQEIEEFRYCLRNFISKDVEFLFGPITSLHNIIRKRVKRRTVQLVRKVD